MHWRQLCQRIQNLDDLYLKREQFADAALAESDKEASKGLWKLSEQFGKRYLRLVNDRRRVYA